MCGLEPYLAQNPLSAEGRFMLLFTPNELAHTCARTERLADRTATPRGGGHPALVCHRVIKACVRPRVRSCGAWLDL